MNVMHMIVSKIKFVGKDVWIYYAAPFLSVTNFPLLNATLSSHWNLLCGGPTALSSRFFNRWCGGGVLVGKAKQENHVSSHHQN